MNTLYLKFRKPIYWEKGKVGLDLVGFTDANCTQELCVWPEFCADQFPSRDTLRTKVMGQIYKIVWKN
jgi:hypothetical protein